MRNTDSTANLQVKAAGGVSEKGYDAAIMSSNSTPSAPPYPEGDSDGLGRKLISDLALPSFEEAVPLPVDAIEVPEDFAQAVSSLGEVNSDVPVVFSLPETDYKPYLEQLTKYRNWRALRLLTGPAAASLAGFFALAVNAGMNEDGNTESMRIGVLTGLSLYTVWGIMLGNRGFYPYHSKWRNDPPYYPISLEPHPAEGISEAEKAAFSDARRVYIELLLVKYMVLPAIYFGLSFIARGLDDEHSTDQSWLEAFAEGIGFCALNVGLFDYVLNGKRYGMPGSSILAVESPMPLEQYRNALIDRCSRENFPTEDSLISTRKYEDHVWQPEKPISGLMMQTPLINRYHWLAIQKVMNPLMGDVPFSRLSTYFGQRMGNGIPLLIPYFQGNEEEIRRCLSMIRPENDINTIEALRMVTYLALLCANTSVPEMTLEQRIESSQTFRNYLEDLANYKKWTMIRSMTLPLGLNLLIIGEAMDIYVGSILWMIGGTLMLAGLVGIYMLCGRGTYPPHNLLYRNDPPLYPYLTDNNLAAEERAHFYAALVYKQIRVNTYLFMPLLGAMSLAIGAIAEVDTNLLSAAVGAMCFQLAFVFPKAFCCAATLGMGSPKFEPLVSLAPPPTAKEYRSWRESPDTKFGYVPSHELPGVTRTYRSGDAGSAFAASLQASMIRDNAKQEVVKEYKKLQHAYFGRRNFNFFPPPMRVEHAERGETAQAASNVRHFSPV